MINQLDHIGIVVRNLDHSARIYSSAFGAKLVREEELPSMKVRIAFLEIGPVTIELIEAMGEGSPVEKFLNERGEGLHHLCFTVDDIDAALAQLKKAGVRLIDEKPRVGAHGKKVAFVHPKSTSGVLIELTQS
ncbi:MAG: methylmalonyl-CoA epimerase [Candidatus Eisenbacteria bacterium]|nr:methylmalonyl-CoA epimerase [Candidatus Eisenbacteria bacterium]